jgi:hypothetical protein
MIRRNRIVFGIASLCLAAGLGYAIRARASGIPSTGALSYAGVLDDANGPITGSHNIQVILYDAASGGNNLCQTTSAAINITNGQFSVLLPGACTTAVGATCSSGVCSGGNPNVWVDVLVDGADTGTTKIGAVPYAVEANHTANADNAANATNCSTCTSATSATSCSSCTNATNATNCSSCTSATSATSCSSCANATNATSCSSCTSATSATTASQSHSVSYESGGAGGGVSFGWNGALEVWVDNTQEFQFAPSLAKTFVIDHPSDSSRYLVHATLEGPESAVFYRGSARLHHGKAEVTLPGYFEAETRPDGRTVLATPTFATVDEPISGLAVSRVRRGGFTVRALDKSNPEQTFDWEVKAVRADVAPLIAEPRRDEVVVHGDGPYTYLTAKGRR